jgi:hypothetical protein
MLKKTCQQRAITAKILVLGLFLGLTIFVNAAELLKPDCVLCGHITDSPTGQAVTDAIVQISGPRGFNAETDSNGFYCFEKIDENGDYRIGIDSNEYVGIYDYDKMPVVNLSRGGQDVKDFKLDRACMFKVQVVDEANQPIEDAEISINSLADERMRRIGSDMRRRNTDKEGFYIAGGISPKTNVLITATHGIRTIVERKDGLRYGRIQWDYAPGHLTITVKDAEILESGRIVLQKGFDVNGIAQYQDGVPASYLEIDAYPEWWASYNSPERYTIDINGCFTLRHIVPGIYQLMVFIPRGTGGSVGIPVSKITLPLPDNEVLKVTIPQKSPQALSSIKGRLVFADGKVPNYVHIEAYSPNGGHHFADWQNIIRGVPADMNFIIDRLEPGKYRLTFSGQDIEQKVLENVEAPTDELIVELGPVEKVVLKGTVINAQTGQPIQNFKARAKKTKIIHGSRSPQSDKWVNFNDSQGRFSFDATGADVYQVQIAADGFAWTWSENINADQNVSAVIKLLPGGAIKGRVVNESGKPVKGAKVLPLSMAGGMWVIPNTVKDPFISEEGAVETGEDGVFELKHLTPGGESIKVIHPDYPYSRIDDIEVKEVQTTENINIVMAAGGIVEGYVYDAQGRAQPNVTLYFQDIYSGSNDKAGRFATVTTDAHGYYRVGGLPEQPLTVKRQRAWDSMGVVSRSLIPANGKISRIDLGGRPIITGRIIINGIPLTSRRIVLSSNESASSDTFRCYIMTAPDGKFAFGGVPDGKWKIYCEDSEKQGDWIKITQVEATEQDVDLGDVAVRLSTICASLEYEPGSAKWDIRSANLQEGDKPWGVQTTKLTQQEDENGPFIVRNIPPGDYYLNFMRQDYLTLRQPVKVNENDVDVTVRIPRCSSGIHGRLTDIYKGGIAFWTKDKLLVGYLRSDANNYYQFNNLPAGHYYVGGNMLIESGAILEFDLADSETKDLVDINMPDDWLKNKQTGSLYVAALDENGSILLGAEARLLGGVNVIEPIYDFSQGIYFIAEPGAYTLQVSFPGYKAITKQVSIEKIDQKNIQALRKPFIVRLERK